MQDYLMDFIKVTQQATISAYPWIGKNDKMAADDAATTSMREQLNLINMDGVIKIGEGEMDEAPMLYIGEKVGTGNGPEIDIAVDPIDGTNLVAANEDSAIAVIAAAEKDSLLHAPDMYMKKIAVGPKAVGKINIDAPLKENMRAVAEAQGKSVSDLTIIVQNRPRHQEIIDEIHSVGATVKLFTDVDITAVIATCIEEVDVDMLVGIGGAPEGVMSAVALKCLGGDFQGQLKPHDDSEYNRCVEMGIADPDRILLMDDIVSSDTCFFVATGITSGILVDGVSKENGRIQTHTFYTNSQDGSYHFLKTLENGMQRMDMAQRVFG